MTRLEELEAKDVEDLTEKEFIQLLAIKGADLFENVINSHSQLPQPDIISVNFDTGDVTYYYE